VALGSPVDLHYHFVVAPDAHFTDDYRVMVHFVNGDGEMMWTDDHQPPIPTTSWKPGQVIDYDRLLFVPVYPYVGPATVQVGLYSAKTQQRLALAGQDVGQHAYKVASLNILPETANVPLSYLEGWHTPETAPPPSRVQWRWTEKDAVLAFPNPKRDATFFLDLDDPSGAFTDAQQVTVTLNSQPVASFALAPRARLLQRIPLTAAQFGSDPGSRIQISVDKTFVPALIPAMNNHDSRELGVRIFQVFVLPK
jgi:hypothetical protein